MKKLLLKNASIVVLALAVVFMPARVQAAGFSGDFSIVGGEITEESPATEEPATEEPATEEPATETPAVETPAVETPAVETPAVETPAVETPAVETPAVETPAVETPAVETFSAKAEKVSRSAVSAAPAIGEVIIIDDEPIPGTSPEYLETLGEEDSQSQFNWAPVILIGAGFLFLLLFLLFNGIYAVEVKEDGQEWSTVQKFYRFAPAVEFLEEKGGEYIRIRHLWRRSDSDVVYSFECGMESCQYASEKEAQVLLKELGFSVSTEALA